MISSNEVKRVRLIYFSGTGGTKRIAEAFEKKLKERGLDVEVKNLGKTLQEIMNASAKRWETKDFRWYMTG